MEPHLEIAPGLPIAHVIKLAIAPVFMVAAIAGLLSMLSSRLGRVIDRARVIEVRVPSAHDAGQQQILFREFEVHWSRIRLINWAIRLCVSGALMICLVIVTLFIGQFVTSNISVLIAAFFVLAMLSVIAGLICLLVEISMATKRIQQGIEVALQDIETHGPRQ